MFRLKRSAAVESILNTYGILYGEYALSERMWMIITYIKTSRISTALFANICVFVGKY